MAMKISLNEMQLLREIEELQHGRLEDVYIPEQEPTERLEIPHKYQVRLINLIREFPTVHAIIVKDRLPLYIEVRMFGRFGRTIKRILMEQ